MQKQLEVMLEEKLLRKKKKILKGDFQKRDVESRFIS